MRKVILTMDENQKYTTIKKMVETNGNKKGLHLVQDALISYACNQLGIEIETSSVA